MMPAVVFDFDGVLVDTDRLRLHAVMEVLEASGLAHRRPSSSLYQQAGQDELVLLQHLMGPGAATHDPSRLLSLAEAAVARRQAVMARGALIDPWACDCILRLSPHVPLAIASGAFHAEIEWILDASGIRHHFRAIVGADDVHRGKPSPEPYLEALRRLEHSGPAVAVEDSRSGLASARHAGLATIALSSSGATLVANHVVTSITDITLDMVLRVSAARASPHDTRNRCL